MKIINLFLFFQLAVFGFINAQCFIIEDDIAGMDNSSFQADLLAAAC